MAVERKPGRPPEHVNVRVRPPVEGGTESTQSLGKFVDNLLGDRRAARKGREAALALTVRVEDESPQDESPSDQEEPLADPDPVDPPPPVEDGTDDERRGARPDSPEPQTRE